MIRILLIDDDPSLHTLLGDYLEQQDYGVLHAHDGQEGLRVIFAERPDLIVLDVMMPHMDGWTALERVREMTEIPVILLTARDNEPDKLRGFRLGSDDYVTKPFSFAELTARIDAVLKRTRSKQKQENTGMLQVGGLMLDPDRHLVMLDNKPLKLTPTEFKLLHVLMEKPGRIFTQEQLVASVWGDEFAEEVGYIRRYIWHLRRKVEPDPDNPRYIHNERGIGYKLEY